MTLMAPQLRHFLKIRDGVNVETLNAELAARPGMWDINPLRKSLGDKPHARMSDIWVRYNDFAKYNPEKPAAFNDEHVPVWYPAWDHLAALKPIVHGLMTAVEGEMLGGVLITRIPPGEGIGRHVDRGWHVEYYDKFYVTLKSSPGADFVCEHDGVTERLNPKPGEIWLFDNRKPHWVENNSMEDRVTLIVCIRTEMFGRHLERSI